MLQEESIRTDDLLERIQESGRAPRHSIAGSEPDASDLRNGQLAQPSWAQRRKYDQLSNTVASSSTDVWAHVLGPR